MILAADNIRITNSLIQSSFNSMDATPILDMEKKLILQKTYLPMLSASGVSIVLMNVLNAPLVQFANACNSLTSKKPFSLLEL